MDYFDLTTNDIQIQKKKNKNVYVWNRKQKTINREHLS